MTFYGEIFYRIIWKRDNLLSKVHQTFGQYQPFISRCSHRLISSLLNWLQQITMLAELHCKTEVKCNKAILFLSQKHTEQSIENIDAFSSLIWRSRTKLVRQSKTEVQRKASSVFWEPLFFWLDLGITRRAAFYDLRAYDDTLDVRNIAMGQQAVSR